MTQRHRGPGGGAGGGSVATGLALGRPSASTDSAVVPATSGDLRRRLATGVRRPGSATAAAAGPSGRGGRAPEGPGPDRSSARTQQRPLEKPAWRADTIRGIEEGDDPAIVAAADEPACALGQPERRVGHGRRHEPVAAHPPDRLRPGRWREDRRDAGNRMQSVDEDGQRSGPGTSTPCQSVSVPKGRSSALGRTAARASAPGPHPDRISMPLPRAIPMASAASRAARIELKEPSVRPPLLHERLDLVERGIGFEPLRPGEMVGGRRHRRSPARGSRTGCRHRSPA